MADAREVLDRELIAIRDNFDLGRSMDVPAYRDAILRALAEAGKIIIDKPPETYEPEKDGCLWDPVNYLNYTAGEECATLDGEFTADDLIQIGLHMRAMVAAGRE